MHIIKNELSTFFNAKTCYMLQSDTSNMIIIRLKERETGEEKTEVRRIKEEWDGDVENGADVAPCDQQ